MARWCGGAMARWCDGEVVRWYGDEVVRWRGRWCDGQVVRGGTVTLDGDYEEVDNGGGG